MRLVRTSIALVAFACLLAPPARAGVLSKVVHGMKQQSGQGAKPDKASSDSDGDGSSSSSRSDWGDSYAGCGDCSVDPTAPIYARGYHPAYPGSGGRERVELYFGLQSVVDSNHAAAISVRATNGVYGAELANTSYFERVPTASGGDETLRLDVWDVALLYRVLGGSPGDRTQIWLRGGFAGASSDGLELFGASLGAQLTHNIAGELGAMSAVRHVRLQDDIHGLEWRVGVAASLVRLSYRYMKFNVGPPLKGPEFGLALHF